MKTKTRSTKKSAASKGARAKVTAKAKAKAKVKAKAKAKPARSPVAKKKIAAAAKKKAAPKKAAAKKATAKRAAPKAAIKRRDATGHLDPKYARELHERSLADRAGDDDRAFVHGKHARDDLAEELAEEAVAEMTSGEDQHHRLTDEEVEEESGGPFVKTRGRDEFARGTDKSNPRSATREPFPRT